MAVHGALLDARGAPLGRGYLASVRSVKLHAARLDDVEGPLQVSAERLSGEDDHVLYAFSVAGDAGELVSGRATVVLDAAHRGRRCARWSPAAPAASAPRSAGGSPPTRGT